jgi:hypothetical protein
VYVKTYPLQVGLGAMFGRSQSRVNRGLQRLLPMVKDAVEELGVLPSRAREQFAEQERGHQERAELSIDGTDRRRQRPKDKAKQTLPYRGKHKTPRDKNLVVVNAKTQRVGSLSHTYAGKVHDKKIVATAPIGDPPDTGLSKDTGFQGYEPKVHQTQQPKKSPARGR